MYEKEDIYTKNIQKANIYTNIQKNVDIHTKELHTQIYKRT